MLYAMLHGLAFIQSFGTRVWWYAPATLIVIGGPIVLTLIPLLITD